MGRRRYYNRYYRGNKYLDAFDAIVIVFFFVFLSWLIEKLLIATGIAMVVAFLLIVIKPKVINWYKVKKGKEELIAMAKAAGATEVTIDPETRKLSLNLPKDKKEVILADWKNYMESKGLKLTVQSAETEEEIVELKNSNHCKTTASGYINRNNQMNHGRKEKSGNHYNQWFYEMECLDCGYRYNANGSDIWLRKCPKCQNGRP